jgi:hypothetical protein
MNTSAAGNVEFGGCFRESLTGELAANFATVPPLPPAPAREQQRKCPVAALAGLLNERRFAQQNLESLSMY